MILLIDNYDSFTYNLFQYIKEDVEDVMVVRNDKINCEEIRALHPDAIIFSPGAGRPNKAGNMEIIMQAFYKEIPMLGICLGHQGIGEVFKAHIVQAEKMRHGEATWISIDETCPLFIGLSNRILVGRYHSLVIQNPSAQLRVVAQSDEGEIMAVAHKEYPVYGIQFHPESILTPMGKCILHNFLKGV